MSSTKIVKDSTKHSVGRQQCKQHTLLHFRGNTEHYYPMTAISASQIVKMERFIVFLM